jgi:peptide/nickel transport system substrate-binding protein
MRRRPQLSRTAPALVGFVCALGLATAGFASSNRTAAPASTATTASGEHLRAGIRGGELTAYQHADFNSLDPGTAYDAYSGEVIAATQRPLFSYLPDQTRALSPDLASGPAIISDGGRTITVHIKRGIHFSPPVNREVTSADVAYAIERGANPSVGTPYFGTYFDYVVGASKATGGPIHGIATPDRYTIIFHLTGPYGTFFAQALSLPVTAPVPKEFAAPLDAHKLTSYGTTYLVATGPYMIKADSRGKIAGVGYQPGTSVTLVRNPNWNPKTDARPAYLNQINIKIGGDADVYGRQVLAGTDAVQSDLVAQPVAALAYQHYRSQLTVVPGAGLFYVALDNKRGPFRNVNARKALWAALDREAMLKTIGGRLAGQVATHFIYPSNDGFELAGGTAGPQYDYNRFPAGNMTVATRYMKAAGYRTGRYTGGATIQVVGVSGDPFASPAEIVNQTLRNLGFNTNFTLVSQAVIYTKFCSVPAQEIDVCPDSGWSRDFADPQTVLDPLFAGYHIARSGNSNIGQVDNPQINAAMKAAEKVVGAQARARAWARIDRMLVAIAAGVPWAFQSNPVIESRDVRGVSDLWNWGFWDYAYTSLKRLR